MAEEEDIDVQALSQEKIKAMMKRDPNFIKRLITQLDKQMANMMTQKKLKQDQMLADQAEIDKIDGMIKSHVQPNLEKLNESIKSKTDLRNHAAKELANQTENLKKMERDAAALISSIRTKSTKLNRTMASQHLEATRGFSSSVSTSTLIKHGTSLKTKTQALE
ncbi:hypothetical protein CEUSTIGMA_g9440.t1 [Chlamydomonas eustigma]|uniref:Uncharacterized protein n=1 Tax=Chlamydomonas eustigma TaxID=1157962 RepID=A0A250XGG6_9CHLO|nr:hypothetical protein CEUSTIGMA_g9440.t1 [Chlamydomonas eustigma]|eukprot:GAX82012.1 hypothetical protein CEUSTIGMA_g9440.t1 [Chlamydomonas eustigma]